jgi:hypothetical protein
MNQDPNVVAATARLVAAGLISRVDFEVWCKTGKSLTEWQSTSDARWLIAGTPVSDPYPAAALDAWMWSNAWWVCAFSDGRICVKPGGHGGCVLP